MIGAAFALLALYLAIQSSAVLIIGYHPHHSIAGIIWTAVTAAAMFALAAGKAATGAALGNSVLRTEGRVTLIDGVLATAVLAGLALDAGLGWWQADPLAGYVLVFMPSARSGTGESSIACEQIMLSRPLAGNPCRRYQATEASLGPSASGTAGTW